jgi:hypothetical protein
MNEYNKLIFKIDSIENELQKRPEEIIDCNSPVWMSFLKTSEMLSADLNNQFNDLRTILINVIANSDEKTVDLLREKILSSKNVLSKIKIPISEISNTIENIQKIYTNALILEAFIGLEPDARDVMLELADFVKFAKKTISTINKYFRRY